MHIESLESRRMFVVVMYTWGGDADLSGELNGDDYFFIDSDVLNNPNVFGYHTGDFDYSGEINGDDYFIIDQNILFAQDSVSDLDRNGRVDGDDYFVSDAAKALGVTTDAVLKAK